MSSLTQDAMLSDAAKYFKMKTQASIASHLAGYVLTTSQPLSILLGKCYHTCFIVCAMN